MVRKVIKIMSIIFFVILTLFIFLNSSRDAAQSTAQSSPFSEMLRSIILFFKPDVAVDMFVLEVIVRKTAHFAEFAVQSALLAVFLFVSSDKPQPLTILFVGLLTACIDEFIQIFPEGRSSQVSDIFVDFAGCCTVTLIYMIITKVRRKKAHGFMDDTALSA